MSDFFESTALDVGKKMLETTVGAYIDKKRLEDIFVQAGYDVANYERDETEESELRQVIFQEDNMKMLANALLKVDAFQWETYLDIALDDLIDASGMSDENKRNAKKHIKDIVIHSMQLHFSQIMQKNYTLQARDNTVAILGQVERQYDLLYSMKQRLEVFSIEHINSQSCYERQEQSTYSGRISGFCDNTNRIQTKWKLKSRCLQGSYSMQSLTQIWREEREAYPGWYILPQDQRSGLRFGARESILLGKKDASIEERLHYCYEYAWRMEKGLFLYEKRTQEQVRNIWEDYRKTALEKEEKSEELEKQWIYIGQVLLREYREDGAECEWKTVYKILDTYFKTECMEADELRLERIKFLFSRFHISKVKLELYQWKIPKEQFELRLQAIGLLAECGESQEAWLHMVELRKDIIEKQQDEMQEDYELFLKSLSVCMLQLESLLLQGNAFLLSEYEGHQEEINRILERIEEERSYFDWREIRRAVKEALLDEYVKECEEKVPFDLNRENVTIFSSVGRANSESYYLYRLLDMLALPLELNHVTLIGNLELPWLRMLFYVNTHLAMYMLVRGTKKENCEKLINYKFLAETPLETLASELGFLMEVMQKNLEAISETSKTRGWGIYEAIQQNVPVLIQRLNSRSTPRLQRELLALLKQLMECEELPIDFPIDEFLIEVMQQISEVVKAEEIGGY